MEWWVVASMRENRYSRRERHGLCEKKRKILGKKRLSDQHVKEGCKCTSGIYEAQQLHKYLKLYNLHNLKKLSPFIVFWRHTKSAHEKQSRKDPPQIWNFRRPVASLSSFGMCDSESRETTSDARKTKKKSWGCHSLYIFATTTSAFVRCTQEWMS